MRNACFSFIIVVLLIASSSVVWGHAVPTSSTPSSGESRNESPAQVLMEFSERLETSSTIDVVDARTGKAIGVFDVVIKEKGVRASVPMLSNGTYIVRWMVMSRDDGHHTEGSYSFSVGGSCVGCVQDIVVSGNSAEVAVVFVELLGQVLILASMLLVFWGVRGKEHGSHGDLLRKAGASCIVASCVAYLFIIQPMSFADASRSMIGMHVIARGLLACVVFGMSRLGVVGLLFGVSVLSRAWVSHAAAQEFAPLFSIVVNAVHLVAKEAWVAALLVGVVLICRSSHGHKKEEVLKSSRYAWSMVSRMIWYAILVGGVTGLYITWLHLKGFGNIMTTTWGLRFVMLLCAALALGVLRVLLWVMETRLATTRHGPVLFMSEFLVGLMVLVFTASMIITTPPLTDGVVHVQDAHSEGVHISFVDSPYDARSFHVIFSEPMQGMVVFAQHPVLGVIELGHEHRDEKNIRIAKDGVPAGASVRIVGTRAGMYDSIATFTPVSHSSARSFDWFAGVFVGVALLVVVGCMAMQKAAWTSGGFVSARVGVQDWAVPIIIAMVIVALVMSMPRLVHGEFQVLCVTDGNVWRQSVPMESGIVLSSNAAFGCAVRGDHIVEYESYLRARDPSLAPVRHMHPS